MFEFDCRSKRTVADVVGFCSPIFPVLIRANPCLLKGGVSMSLMCSIEKNKPQKGFLSWCLIALLSVVFVLPAGTADSPGDPKRVAFEVVDRNAEQIATWATCFITMPSRECRNTRAQDS
jgi:hypothetical protein